MILGGKLDFNSDMQKTARSASFPQTKISTGGSRVSEQGYVAVDRTKNHSPWICPSVIYSEISYFESSSSSCSTECYNFSDQ